MSSEEAERAKEERQRKLEELKLKADVLLDFSTPVTTESTVIEVQRHPLRDDKSDQHIPVVLCGRSFILRITNEPNHDMRVTVMNGDPYTSFNADFSLSIMDAQGEELQSIEEMQMFLCCPDCMDLHEWQLQGGIKQHYYEAEIVLDKKEFKAPPHEDYTSFRVKLKMTCRSSYSNTRVTYNTSPSMPSVCGSVDSQARWQTGPTDGQEGSVFITIIREGYDKCRFVLWGRAYDVFSGCDLLVANGSRTEARLKWSYTFYDHEGQELGHEASEGNQTVGVLDPTQADDETRSYIVCHIDDLDGQYAGAIKQALQRGPIHVSVTITEYTPFLMESCAAAAPEASSRSLNTDMLGLFQSGRTTDITFLVEGQSIPAHRALLAARCPVPIAHEEMAEGKPGAEIVITDVSAPVFKAFLRYLYSDSVEEPDLENLGLGLLRVADKYGLEDLKRICSHYLSRNLCTSDVWDTLLVAQELEIKALVRRCALLITAKTAEVLASDGYRESASDNPIKATNLLQECFGSTDTAQKSQQEAGMSGKKRRRTW